MYDSKFVLNCPSSRYSQSSKWRLFYSIELIAEADVGLLLETR